MSTDTLFVIIMLFIKKVTFSSSLKHEKSSRLIKKKTVGASLKNSKMLMQWHGAKDIPFSKCQR